MRPSDAQQAAAALRAAHDDRALHARQFAAQGRPVVGYVGCDTPVELITAAGALPVRLAGRAGRDTSLARTYLDGAVDPQVVNVLAAILTPEDGDPVPDLIVITHDCDASLQLFYTLRELRRTGTHSCPPVHFVDLLHLPGEATRRYNLGRLSRFADQLAAWRGRAVNAAELAEAVADHDAARRARTALRKQRASALTGGEALRWYAASTAMPPRAYADTLTAALTGEFTRPEGRPLFVSGSTHDTTDVYDALEGDGWLVVGDDHDWGDGGDQPPVGEPTLEALTDHYTREVVPSTARTPQQIASAARGAVTRSGAAHLLTYCRQYDDAHRWDHPARAAAAGVPAALLRDQPYAGLDLPALTAQLAPQEAQMTR
ncbi:2-hydroxyacyl-CoA dehydratase family protein [Streptomyces sp. NBC_00588]|uniref:2-hydroxyacyl-CoA dehydratase family protein n=1 Tax=Streptomyces sp. NBC_00588 TaxID=2975784 RepID=UPI002E82455E|nr:2-hydroxyacyl-CoA dehydratase family protein [Streptomyces sp. NBC_00588]WUB41179.1 2-hydroxyacyl-CoA dehydratase family protein [Streptomyces sp. NBC_00588]